MTRSASSSARAARQRRVEKNANVIGYWIIGVSAAIVLLVVIAVALSNRPQAVTVSAPDVPAEWIEGRSLGNPDAPVTIEMWEDFYCPACRQFNAVIKPRLMEDYVQPGHVRLQFEHFPLQSHAPMAQQSAAASECAVEQGAFWPYHDRLFPAQDQGQAGFTPESLIRYAGELGMDEAAFRQCVASQKHVSAVTNSFNRAISIGLNATPSVLINGAPVADPFDYDALSAQIDGLLAAE